MGLANIYYPPAGEGGWEDFWFNNFQDHELIQSAVQTQKSINNPIYPIIPWRQDNINNILELHQMFHNDMNDALGLPGQDLSSLDLKDHKSVQDWCFNHFSEHQAAHQVLNV